MLPTTPAPRGILMCLLASYIPCRGEPGVTILLEGCVDVIDNSNQPFTAVTDGNGMAYFNKPPVIIQYCYGSATGYCRWSASKDGKTYVSSLMVSA